MAFSARGGFLLWGGSASGVSFYGAWGQISSGQDTSNDGDVSKSEFGLLAHIWTPRLFSPLI